MTGRALGLVVGAALGLSLLAMGGLLTLAGAATACARPIPPPTAEPTAEPTEEPTAESSVSEPPAGRASTQGLSAASAASGRDLPDMADGADVLDRYDEEQLRHAGLIVAVGVGRGIPERGWVVAVATAMQESSLRNLPHLGARNDHDSLGLFQQRPSQGWGSTGQLQDPHYATGAFYDALLRVPGWQDLELTEAAQAVQRSAHPDAYGRWEADATALVAVVTGGYGQCVGGDGMSVDAVALPPGYTLPAGAPPGVRAAVAWALAQLGSPYSYGGDCTAAHSGDPARQCDCSSLVQQAYAHAGVTLPRTTEHQQHTGTPVPRGDLSPGDLVFIPGGNGTPTDPGHVGLYIGDGLVLHAPHTGDVVKLTPLTAWEPEISTIRRVIPVPATG
ncbi:MAG: C40 family peptidase [Actinomycetales bacterium]